MDQGAEEACKTGVAPLVTTQGELLNEPLSDDDKAVQEMEAVASPGSSTDAETLGKGHSPSGARQGGGLCQDWREFAVR